MAQKDTVKRNILYYEFYFQVEKEHKKDIEADLKKVFEYIVGKDTKSRTYFLDKSNTRPILLSSANKDYTNIKFRSARCGYVPELLNTKTFEIKQSDKLEEEGDLDDTHVRFDYAKSTLLLEQDTENNICLRLGNIRKYINAFIDKYNTENEDKIKGHFCADIIVSNDFIKSIEDYSNISSITIYNEQKAGNSYFKDYCDGQFEEKTVQIQTSLKFNDKKCAMKLIKDYMENKTIHTRIRIQGKTIDDERQIIDTSKAILKQQLEVKQGKDKHNALTEDIFEKLNNIDICI